jgi:hypothetical protein
VAVDILVPEKGKENLQVVIKDWHLIYTTTLLLLLLLLLLPLDGTGDNGRSHGVRRRRRRWW